MSNEIVLDVAALPELPLEWPEDLLPTIRMRLQEEGTIQPQKVVILDDDPTGTQTVCDIAVLTGWSVDVLKDELLKDGPAFYILTNSRSLPEEKACRLASEIGSNLLQASSESGVKVTVVSRSDSTLRGHFPAEVNFMARAMGQQGLPYLIVPFFLEGGRYTLNDVHYVREGESLIPAAQTPFARDASFGFTCSNLREWVTEKTAGHLQPEAVHSITLEDIRTGGPDRVAQKLLKVPANSACIVNCVSYRDMEVVVAGLLFAEGYGNEFLYRTAASFVRTRIGQAGAASCLGRDEIVADTSSGGLFVIGSYVEKTSRQVEALFSRTDIERVMVDVEKLLAEDSRAPEIKAACKKCNELLEKGRDVALYTSRRLITGKSAEESLEIGRIVSESLIEIVRSISVRPRYLVAKGGITSSDVATKALLVRRAMIIGQPLPGVPAWRLGEESRYPGMVYIVFPGNVGSDDALAELQLRLGNTSVVSNE